MILAVTLGSAGCDRAVTAAARQAGALERPLRIVYVADTSFMDDVSRGVSGERAMDAHLRRIGRLILKRVEALALEHASLVETEVLEGEPEAVLVETIRGHRINQVYLSRDCLEVLGDHAPDELRRALGSAGAEVHVID